MAAAAMQRDSSQSPSIAQIRRARQRSAREAEQGRLAAALRRVSHLEEELATLQAASEAAKALPNNNELIMRLQMVAPKIVEGMAKAGGDEEVNVSQLHTSRRNAASHCFSSSARDIAGMQQAQLNKLQRSQRRVEVRRASRRGPARRHRRPPVQRLAAEAVPPSWTVRTSRRGGSAPALFDLADKVRKAPPLRPRQVVTGAKWFDEGYMDSPVESQEPQFDHHGASTHAGREGQPGQEAEPSETDKVEAEQAQEEQSENEEASKIFLTPEPSEIDGEEDQQAKEEPEGAEQAKEETDRPKVNGKPAVDEDHILDEAIRLANQERAQQRAHLAEVTPKVLRILLKQGMVAPCGHQICVAPAMLRTPSSYGDTMACVICAGAEGQISFACAGRCGFVVCKCCAVMGYLKMSGDIEKRLQADDIEEESKRDEPDEELGNERAK